MTELLNEQEFRTALEDAIKGREDVGNVINCLPHLEKALASIK